MSTTSKTATRRGFFKHGPKSSCKVVRRVELEVVVHAAVQSATPPGFYPYRPARTTYRESWPQLDRTCPACAREQTFHQIKGVRTETPCGAKCLASKGPSCECSCGGANHGRNHG